MAIVSYKLAETKNIKCRVSPLNICRVKVLIFYWF